MPAWPPTLPQVPLRQGNREALGEGRLRTAMDAGPAKVRRRTTAAPSTFAFPMVLTAGELDDFLTFWHETTAGGSLAFDFTHPRTGAAVSARFAGEPPAWEQVGEVAGEPRYELAVVLEILP